MKSRKKDILDGLNGVDALRVLRSLCDSDREIRDRVLSTVQQILEDVDTDEVAEDVWHDLDALSVEEIWDHSGPSQNGYDSCDETVAVMFEEALQPYVERVEKYRRIGMPDQYRQCVMGILKGLYRFEMESKSEFKDWASDVSPEWFGTLLSNWRKHARTKDLKTMKTFLATECPEWAKWAMKG